MRTTINLTLTDGTELTVDTGWADALAVEEKFDVPMGAFGGDTMRGLWMTYMAWHAAHRRGLTTVEWDDFKAAVETLDVEVPDDADVEGEVPEGEASAPSPE